MADDNHSRYRSSDPFARGAAPAAPNNDPLAELARLIGQNDAVHDYGRQPTGTPRYGNPAPSYGQEPAPHYGNNPAPNYGHDPSQHYAAEPEPHYGHEAAPRYEAEPRFDDPPRYADERVPHNDWHNGGPPPLSYRPDDQFPLPSQQHAPAPPARAYDNAAYGHQDYANPNHAAPGYADPLGQPPRDSYSPEPAEFDQDQNYPQPLYPQEPGTGAMPPPHDDEFYDDAPRGRRRSLMTVVAVLALAVIGTAGAFGYRSLFGGSGAPAVPPVIRASGEPSRVAPPPAPDQSVNKFTYDRFGDAGKDEQMVRRDEKPLDLSKLTPTPATMTPARPQAGGATANPPSAIGDPRRVRTVPIRPNQSDGAAAMPSMPSTAPIPMAPQPQQASALAANEPPQATEPPQPAPRATSSRTAQAASPAPARPARSTHTPAAQASGAPLSLSPDANNALPPPSAAQPSAPRPAAPTRTASAPAAASNGGGGGSYLVQVSSQKSEADAESAYRGISSKYSSVIGSQPHTVRRADLGSKGIFYRAMVGPFASREQAVSVCTSLKQAGGDCVVQH